MGDVQVANFTFYGGRQAGGGGGSTEGVNKGRRNFNTL